VIRYCGILTCLGTVPPKPLFRPAYCGSVKSYHYLEDMDLSILPDLPPVSTTPTFQALYNMMKRAWAPDFPCGWVGDYFHPSEHMPNYGRDFTVKANDVAVALLLGTESMIRDHGYPADWKQQLAIPLIQFGIDSYGIVRNGGGWGWTGGGIGQGRKWPILFAGLALDDPAMKNVGTDYGQNLQHRQFMDDAQVFYLSQEDVDRFPMVATRTNCRVDVSDPRHVYDDDRKDWSIADDGTATPYREGQKLLDYWLLWDVEGAHQLVRVVACEGVNSEILYVQTPLSPGQGKTARVRLFAPERLGMPEWGERHMNNPQNDYYSRAYRMVATGNSLAGAQLTALALRTRDGRTSAKELWNWPAFFDYMDMYMQEHFDTGWYRQWSDFAEQMWDTYRPQYGPIWPNTAPGTTGENRAPVLAYIGDRTATTEQVTTFMVIASDPDGDSITFSATGLPGGATFVDQAFTWTPAADQIGSHRVTFTVSDGQAQDSETITITVAAAAIPNSPPVLGDVGGKSVNENELLSFAVGATDADSQDALSYSATGLPSGAGFSGQTFSWTPNYSQAGSYQVTFIVSDGRDQDSETVTISVANLNRAPALNSVSDRSVDPGNTLEFSLSAVDADGDSLTYSATGLPAGANLSGQNFTWTPTSGQIGSYDITFTASDGSLGDAKAATIVVVAAQPDTAPPVVARGTPEPDAIQVPLNSLVTLQVTDAGTGVDAATVVIRVDDQFVYQGHEAVYTSPYGRCNRSGPKSDYRYIYQPDQMFDFDQMVVVKVNAADLQGNAMNEYSYSYLTEMRSFGANKQLSKGTGSSGTSRPATARDAAGNLWAAWHAGPQGGRDIYVAKLVNGGDSFQTPVRLTTDGQDQCYPDLAAGPDGKLHIAWQDNRRGNWDIFASVCSDRQNFSRETRVSDSNDNEINPAIAVDGQSPNSVHVAWQDGRNGNQDIYRASSANAFVSTTISRVTTDMADQTDPDITVGGQNTVYLVWTDMRNGQADLYGAASNAGPWTNVPIVTSASTQTDPAVAAEPGGSDLHLLWVDNARGDQDIYYASLAGLPDSPVTGRTIVDDTSGADQLSPAVACGANGKAFACWQDSRHEGAGTDTDLYFAELRSGIAGTNVLVGDNNTKTGQTEPAIGVNTYGHPYVIWSDDRDQHVQVYYAAGTFIHPDPLDSRLVAASAGGTIGTEPSAISKADDVSIVVPPGACRTDMRVTISRVINPQVKALECLGSYEFGPSGIDFDLPVTVTIPYRFSGGGRRALPYWYDALTGILSQQGITEVENVVVSSNLNALRFKTMHFTAYYLVAGDSESDAEGGVVSGEGGGGGCSISATGKGSSKELLIPYAAIATIFILLRRRDKRRQKFLDNIQE